MSRALSPLSPKEKSKEVTVKLTDRNADFVSDFESLGFSSPEDLINTAIRQLRTAEQRQEMAKDCESAYKSLEDAPKEFFWETIDREPFAGK